MKRYGLLLLACLLVLFTGCQQGQKEGDRQVNPENADRTTFPASYQASGEHVNINIENIQPEEAYFIKGSAKSINLDYEKIGKMLIPENEIGEADIENKQILSKNLIDDVFYEKMFIWGKEGFNYYTHHGYELFCCVNAEKKGDDYNLPLYSREQEFSFGSAEDALKDIKANLNELGIQIDETYLVHTYYLDHETLQQQESHYDMEGNRVEDEYKTDWSEEDDAYLFYINSSYCGLPDYHSSDFAPVRAEDSSAQISVLYGKEGILDMEVDRVSIYEMGNQQMELLSFENIAEAVINYYDNILDNATYEVTEAQLVCDYDASYTKEDVQDVCPVWVFHVTETNEGDTPINYEVRFDACTGNQIQ